MIAGLANSGRIITETYEPLEETKPETKPGDVAQG
jgi:hypothetical protein